MFISSELFAHLGPVNVLGLTASVCVSHGSRVSTRLRSVFPEHSVLHPEFLFNRSESKKEAQAQTRTHTHTNTHMYTSTY